MSDQEHERTPHEVGKFGWWPLEFHVWVDRFPTRGWRVSIARERKVDDWKSGVLTIWLTDDGQLKWRNSNTLGQRLDAEDDTQEGYVNA